MISSTSWETSRLNSFGFLFRGRAVPAFLSELWILPNSAFAFSRTVNLSAHRIGELWGSRLGGVGPVGGLWERFGCWSGVREVCRVVPGLTLGYFEIEIFCPPDTRVLDREVTLAVQQSW